MKNNSLALTLCFILFLNLPLISGNLNIEASKNSLNLQETDSIVYTFYLSKPLVTTIRFVNIFGGETIDFETEKPREKGWHNILLHTDSIKQYGNNLTSGVYYFEISGKDREGNEELYFNSYNAPWGAYVKGKHVKHDAGTGEISYEIDKYAMVRARVGFPDGGLVTSLSMAPNMPGALKMEWQGYDQSQRELVQELPTIIQVTGYSLPETSFYLSNPDSPIDYQSEPAYPENWNKYALYGVAKKPWNENYDIPLNFDIKISKRDAFTISFPDARANLEQLNNKYPSDNEIYVSVDGEFFVETYNIDVYGGHEIAIPELPRGKHLFIANLIFGGEIFAIGVKEVIVK